MFHVAEECVIGCRKYRFGAGQLALRLGFGGSGLTCLWDIGVGSRSGVLEVSRVYTLGALDEVLQAFRTIWR